MPALVPVCLLRQRQVAARVQSGRCASDPVEEVEFPAGSPSLLLLLTLSFTI